MIERLDWDSEFFGYEVGKLVHDHIDFDVNSFEIQAGNYKLVYIFSTFSLIPKEIFSWSERRVVFRTSTARKNEVYPSVSIFNEKTESYSELLKLYYLSGSQSRFKLDESFRVNEFERLYGAWLNKDLDAGSNTQVYIMKNEVDIQGFVTLENPADQAPKIGLIAVNPSYLRKGIARNLVMAMKQISYEEGFEYLDVTTQSHNTPAMQLYRRCNFEVYSEFDIYHYWNL